MAKRIEQRLFKGYMIIIYGARRVGKTVLVRELMDKHDDAAMYINCDLLHNRQVLEAQDVPMLKMLFGNKRLIILDEAQRVHDVGRTLKIIADELPEYQVVATGSSSFDLANKTAEPLTGRALRYLLLPFSVREIAAVNTIYPFANISEQVLRYGMYPPVYLIESDMKPELLNEITGNYLYQDILALDNINRSDVLMKLCQALALQLGQEVSTNELSQLVGVSRATVERYIDLLEKCFVLFRLRPLARNQRKEISGKCKIYFYDVGVRNSLIHNLAPLALRNDVGALWENFCIVEKLKADNNNGIRANYYFWRTYTGKEVDLIVERDGQINGYEFKWNDKAKSKNNQAFLAAYPNSEVVTISPMNYLTLIDSNNAE